MWRNSALDEIIYKKNSIAMFGDGEFAIIFEKNIKFQKYNETQKDKLLNILYYNNSNL